MAACSYASYVFISDLHRVRCTTRLCSWPCPLVTIRRRSTVADWRLWSSWRVTLHPRHFADDTQIYGFCSPTPSSCTELQSRISECIDVASSWMRSHRLQLSTAKTEIVTGRRSHLLPLPPLRVGSDLIMPVLVARDLGIHIDAEHKFWVLFATGQWSTTLC